MKVLEIQYKEITNYFSKFLKRQEEVILEDGIFYYQFGILDLKNQELVPNYVSLRDNSLLHAIGRRESPSPNDIRDSLLASKCLPFKGLEKLFKFIDLYMEVTERAPLALGVDTNVILNGLINLIREKVRGSEWKGSLEIAIPTVVLQEVNRLLLEKYPDKINAPLKRKDIIKRLPSKMSRLAIIGIGNIQKLRSQVQVEMIGRPLSPNVFLSSSAGRYFNDFVVREQIRDFARKTGKPTIHISADRDSVNMARAEGLPSILIELPPYPKRKIAIGSISDFLYSLALLRGIIEIRDKNQNLLAEIRTIWHGKHDHQFFEHIIQLHVMKE